jgi:hypothetical protein
MKKAEKLNNAETQTLNIPVVSGSLDTIPLFQYNVAIEGQRQMIEHIEYLNREIERKNTEILEKDKLIEIYKDELRGKNYR